MNEMGRPEHRKEFTEARNRLTNSIVKSKKGYIQESIASSSQSQKALFQCVNELLNKTKKTVLPSNITVDELPDAICRFFIEKIKQIQKEFVVDDSLVTHEQGIAPHKQKLKTFRPATEDEVREVLKQTAKKSCSLDPIPAFLLMECTEELLPVITRIINLSLSTSHVPTALKTAVVTPVLKKPTADPDELTNFRPVSNLPFLVKLLEKVVSRRLKDHKTENELYEHTQSAYRAGHSMETALLKVQNDILRAIDTGHCVFLVLLDLSAAFDTVAHHILLERMKTKFGVVENAHEWLASYLKDRTQSVFVSGSSSSPVPLTCGVPQGSVLGPDLFSDYSSPAAAIIRSYKVSVHCYADDTQLYRAFTPGEDELEVLGQMEQCISELRNWMSRNMLKLNDDKTEFIILGTDVSLKKVKIESIKVGNHEIKTVESVRNIGAMFDKRMKMKAQVKHMCKGAWHNIHSIGKIRQYLTQDQTKTVVHAHVISKLDNNNSLLTGIPQYVRRRLQLAQNAAAKLVTDLRKFDHVTGAMKELHWLPIEKRVIFKCLLIAYKALNGTGPSYIREMLPLAKVYREGLRSSDDPLRLEESRTKLITYGDRAFSIATVKTWNDLPLDIRMAKTVDIFISKLKTHFFQIVYG